MWSQRPHSDCMFPSQVFWGGTGTGILRPREAKDAYWHPGYSPFFREWTALETQVSWGFYPLEAVCSSRLVSAFPSQLPMVPDFSPKLFCNQIRQRQLGHLQCRRARDVLRSSRSPGTGARPGGAHVFGRRSLLFCDPMRERPW